MILIGLSGKRGSGKDLTASMLQVIQKRMDPSYPGPGSESKMPDPFQILKFADIVKEVTAMVTGRPLSKMYTQEGKTTYMPEFGMTIGEAQQKIGTEGMRKGFHEEVWVLATLKKAVPGGDYLITDVRFPNEVMAIHQAGGIVLRLEGDPLQQQGDGTRDDNHISETALDDYPFEYVIKNDGTKDQLFNKILQFYVAVISNR